MSSLWSWLRPRTASDAARELARAGHAKQRATIAEKTAILRAELAAGKHTTIAPREQVVATVMRGNGIRAMRESAR